MKTESNKSLISLTATSSPDDEDEPSQNNESRQRGFTVTELLVVIAIIGVLMGSLFPAVGAAREAANRIAVQNDLRQMCCAVHEFRELNGRFPASFAELIRFCEDQLPNLRTDCCAGVLSLAAHGLRVGTLNGYVFTVTEASESTWKAQAVPARPGKTGSEGLMMDQDCNVSSFSIPGADVIKQRMFTNIFVKGAEVVTELLTSTDAGQSAIPLVRNFVESPDTVPIVFNTLDANGDQVVTPQEILNQGPGPGGFIDFVKAEMEFGVANEDVGSLPGVSLADLHGDPAAPLFSYEGLCHLTQVFVQHHGVANSLCAKLAAAEAAEARGDARAKAEALAAYRNEVAAQRGESLTDREAAILTTLSETL